MALLCVFSPKPTHPHTPISPSHGVSSDPPDLRVRGEEDGEGEDGTLPEYLSCDRGRAATGSAIHAYLTTIFGLILDPFAHLSILKGRGCGLCS